MLQILLATPTDHPALPVAPNGQSFTISPTEDSTTLVM